MGDGPSALHHQRARVQSDEYLLTCVISPCPLPNAYPPPWPYCFFLLLPFFLRPFPSCSSTSSYSASTSFFFLFSSLSSSSFTSTSSFFSLPLLLVLFLLTSFSSFSRLPRLLSYPPVLPLLLLFLFLFLPALSLPALSLLLLLSPLLSYPLVLL